MKYGLHGKLLAKAGEGKALAKILMQAAELMSKAPGCELYLVSLDTQNEDEIWITEVWKQESDHDASLSIAGVRELIASAMPLLGESPKGGQKLQVLGGHGLK